MLRTDAARTSSAAYWHAQACTCRLPTLAAAATLLLHQAPVSLDSTCVLCSSQRMLILLRIDLLLCGGVVLSIAHRLSRSDMHGLTKLKACF